MTEVLGVEVKVISSKGVREPVNDTVLVPPPPPPMVGEGGRVGDTDMDPVCVKEPPKSGVMLPLRLGVPELCSVCVAAGEVEGGNEAEGVREAQPWEVVMDAVGEIVGERSAVKDMVEEA